MYDYEIEKYAIGIPHFRGVFMRNNLPKKSWKKECGIVNLDSTEGFGTHWVAYRKKNHNVAEYFDSFGDLKPPKELVNYLKCEIFYNRDRYQNFNSKNCGRLCLEFLMNK